MGTGYFDEVAGVIGEGRSSTTAFKESTEAEQFYENGIPPSALRERRTGRIFARPRLAGWVRPILRSASRRFTREQQRLVRTGGAARASARGELPTYSPPSEATTTQWRIELPAWCSDQRNQMTGPADDAELGVKMLNSGAPGVMLDLEDSMANTWDHLMLGHATSWLRSTAT